MTSQSMDHGSHGEEEHGIHLPDPSVWPLVVGAASLIAGIALIWWSRDRSSDIAGPVLGIGLAFVLMSAAGWAIEDGRMRRKAEEGHMPDKAPGRFTQVLTFAVAEGQLDAARARGGVIQQLQDADLRDYEGFRDLRVTVSPAASGPSQVLVETSWKGREGLDAYEATRQTLLDTIASHEAQVVPGTAQAFDMEIVRDTKETAFKFGMGGAATMLAGLVLGGFALGAGLSLFQNESKGGEGGPTEEPPAGNVVRGLDNRFVPTTLLAPPNTAVSFEFDNRGRAKHNLHFLDKKGGTTLAPGAEGAIIDGGVKETLSFTTPGAGTYFFQCDVHPDQMVGTFEVKEGAPVPGAAAAPAAGAATATATATAAK